MTPAITWTALALLGLVLTLWNLRDGGRDWWRARRGNGDGSRRIATEMFLVMYLAHFVGYAIWLWIGIAALTAGAAGSWAILTALLVSTEGLFVVKSVLLRIFRYRLDHYQENA
jgi:hypothetical protein